MTSEDNGFTLTCIAENVVGMSNASVALTVHCEWTPLWRAGGTLGISAQEAGMGWGHCNERGPVGGSERLLWGSTGQVKSVLG